MISKVYKTNTYNIYTVKTNKFKTCHMEIIFRNNIDRNNITKRNLITELIVENSKKYSSRKDMIKELENLYNSYFYGITNRVGKSIITSFCFDFINPKLVDEKLDEFIKFPIECIMNPNAINDEFDISTFEYVKNRVRNDIESIIEDPKLYGTDKLLNNMCSDTESSININGYVDDLDFIDNSNIYDYYKQMIEHDYIDVYIIGDIDMNYASKLIKDNLKINILKNHLVDYKITNKLSKKINTVYEYLNCGQENICIGLNIENMTDFERDYVSHIYNMILGGNSLDTKLYNKLRNENSICYNCSSLYQKFDSLILIHTAISEENEKFAIKLIKEALLDMVNGNITEDEIDCSKKALITSLNMSNDSPGRIIDNYLFKNLFGLSDIDERIKKFNEVTKEDIINFARKVKINTILCLRDGENEKN